MSEKTIVYPLSMGVNAQTIGDLTDLTTTNKLNVVASINEVNAKFPVSIANGGTGGTTATEARTNLEVQKEYSLYANANGTQSSIVLSDSIYNYDSIKVYFRDDNRCFNSIQTLRTASDTPLQISFSLSSVSSAGRLYVKAAQIQLSGTTVTWRTDHYGSFGFKNREPIAGDPAQNSLYILKITGFKY